MTEELVAKYRARISNIIKTLGDLFGYEVSLEGKRIILRSVFAFEEDDVIVLAIEEDRTIRVEQNEFTSRFKNEKNIYLDRGKSIAAFLSAVTLSLFEQKTFQ